MGGGASFCAAKCCVQHNGGEPSQQRAPVPRERYFNSVHFQKFGRKGAEWENGASSLWVKQQLASSSLHCLAFVADDELP